MHSTRLLISAALAGGLLGWNSHASAASFDCKKAASRVEHQICKDPDLNSLDGQLEAAYLGALDRSNNPTPVKAKQQAWLKERDACADTKCMTTAYLRQIKLLSSMSDEPPICDGGTTPEVNACGQAYAQRAERELARYVAAVHARLVEEATDRSSGQAAKTALTGFDAAQAAWVTFRKAECGAVYDWWSEGTIRGAMYQDCWRSTTKSRTREIWSIWLHFMDDTPPLMPEPTDK